MENKTIFDGFFLDGVHYYFSNGKYYAENGVILETLTEKEYRDALYAKLSKGD